MVYNLMFIYVVADHRVGSRWIHPSSAPNWFIKGLACTTTGTLNTPWGSSRRAAGYIGFQGSSQEIDLEDVCHCRSHHTNSKYPILEIATELKKSQRQILRMKLRNSNLQIYKHPLIITNKYTVYHN